MKRIISALLTAILINGLALPAFAEDIYIHAQRGADIVLPGIGNYTTSTGKITRGATWAYQCGCAAYGAAITVGACNGSTTATESGTTGIYNLTVKAADFANDHCIVALTSATLMGEHIYHLIAYDALNNIDVRSATTNIPAVYYLGNGTAPGTYSKGGATGQGGKYEGGSSSGDGLYLLSNSGNGLYSLGQGSGSAGIWGQSTAGAGGKLTGANAYPALDLYAGATGNAVRGAGGGTSGDAQLWTTTNGHGLNFTTLGTGKVDINAPLGFTGNLNGNLIGTLAGLTLGSLVSSPVGVVDGSTVTIAATSATGSIALKGKGNSQIVLNAGTKTVFVALGTSAVTATTASTPIYPGSSLILPVGNATYIAAICGGSDTTTIYSTSAYTTAR